MFRYVLHDDEFASSVSCFSLLAAALKHGHNYKWNLINESITEENKMQEVVDILVNGLDLFGSIKYFCV